MKTSIVLAIFFWVILAGTSQAVIYKYTDDSGDVHYTNDLESVPRDKLNQVTEMEEPKSEPAAPAPAYSGPIYPLLQNSKTAEEKAAEKKRAEKKAQLQAEYESLLKQKEALDNDKSFQTRRYRRKYKNRPYIKKLVAKETQIKERLAEVEAELKNY